MYGFADKLRSKGRFGDSLVAHLSEAEARLLKKRGGSGTTNPFTGAVEFYKGAAEGEQANNPKSSFFQSLASIDSSDSGEKTRLDGFYNNIQSLYDKNRADTSPKNGETNKFQENQALAVAKILNNTRYVYNDKEGIHQYMFFGTDGGNPFEQSSNQELDKLLHEVSPRIRKLVVGGQGTGATNEDLAARDMSIFLRAIGPNGLDSFKRGRPLVSQENLFKAYEKLGIKPYDYEKGKRHTKGFTGEGWTEYQTINDEPISLAQQEVTDAARGLYSLYKNDPGQFNKSSADSDGTGGTGSAPNLSAGAFDSFGAFAEAAFAPESYNQGSFNNLRGPLSRVTKEGIGAWAYQQFQNMRNNPSTNAAGKAFRNKIDDAVHFGDTLNGPLANMVGHPMGGYAQGTSDNHGYGGGYGNYGFGDGNPFAEGGD